MDDNFIFPRRTGHQGIDRRISGQAEGRQCRAGLPADLAAAEIAAQTSESNAILQYRIAEIGHWYEPDKLVGYSVALYFAKLLVWDKVLGLGTTDPLAGFASTTSNLVISFYFAKRGFENVARIIKR